MALSDVVFSAPYLVGSNPTVGQVVSLSADGTMYIPFTGGLFAGVVTMATSGTGATNFVQVQVSGVLPNSLTALGNGTASPVIASPTTSALVRKSSPVYGTDAIVGDCDVNGNLFLTAQSRIVPSSAGPQGIQGLQGNTGTAGTSGTNGAPAYTTTSGSYTQPAVGSSVTVTVANTSWMAVGEPVYVATGGAYTVASLPSQFTASLTLVAVGSVAVGGTVTSNALVTPSGVQGPTGPGGGFTAGGDLTGSSTSQQVQSLTGNATTGQVPFPVAATGPGLTQPSTTAATAANMVDSPQASTATNGTPGSRWFTLAIPTGTGTEPQAKVRRGTVGIFAVQAYPGAPSFSALYLAGNADAPSTSNASLVSNGGYTFLQGSSELALAVNGTTYWDFQAGQSASAFEIIGFSAVSSPYGVHGDVSINTTTTLTAAQFAQQLINTTPATAITLSGFPRASAGFGYPKDIYVNAAFAVTVTDGTNSLTLGATVGLHRVWFTNGAIKGT